MDSLILGLRALYFICLKEEIKVTPLIIEIPTLASFIQTIWYCYGKEEHTPKSPERDCHIPSSDDSLSPCRKKQRGDDNI